MHCTCLARDFLYYFVSVIVARAPNFGLLENLAVKFLSKNAKFRAENPHFGVIQGHIFFVHDVAVCCN